MSTFAPEAGWDALGQGDERLRGLVALYGGEEILRIASHRGFDSAPAATAPLAAERG